jgi:hypothetical protein
MKFKGLITQNPMPTTRLKKEEKMKKTCKENPYVPNKGFLKRFIL